MRIAWLLALNLLVACTEPVPAPVDAGAIAPTPSPRVAKPEADLVMRVVGIVDGEPWPDGTPLRVARVEVRNGLAVPVEFHGPPRPDGAVVLFAPDVRYFVRRGEAWQEEFLQIGDLDITNAARTTVEAGASTELGVALDPEMLAGGNADLPWRLCLGGTGARLLLVARCTPPFHPRDGTVVSLPPDPPPKVASIHVEDRWSGLAGPESAWMILTPVAGGYSAENRRGRRKDGSLPTPQAVGDRLVASVRAPAVARAAYLEQSIDSTWLAASAASAYATLPERSPPCRPEAGALFARHFADAAFVRDALVAHYSGSHTDDYPHVFVLVRYDDGTQRGIASKRQQERMLPWTTEAGESWDPAIAEAIVAVLPADSPNRNRLLGRAREALLAEAVVDHIDRDAWFAACE